MFQKLFARNRWIQAVSMGLLIAWGISPAAGAEDAALAAKLAPLIGKHEGQIAVAVKHLGDGRSFAHHADRPQATASLIKFPIMVEAYRQADAGQLDLSQVLTLREEDKAPGSGVLAANFSAGARFTLRDALQLMIAVSDNTATNLVLGEIGLPSTNETMTNLGLPNTRIHALVFRPQSSIAPERSKEFGLGSTTAGEMVRLLELLHLGKLGKEASRAAMLDHLRACDDRTRIPKLLPAGIKVAHKTGSVSAVRTAAGLMETPGGVIALCVLSQQNRDQRWSDDNAANVVIAEIAKVAYDHFNPQSAPEDGVLRLGASGERVQSLQRTLNSRGKPSPALAIDGEFGPGTAAAVKAFQKQAGLPETGEVMPDTWTALGPVVDSEPPAPEPAVVNSRKLALAPRETLDGPPLTTCKAWVIMDAHSGTQIASHEADQPLDMASTTKVMTAWLVLKRARDKPEVLAEEVLISAAADQTPGSTAGVRAGERLPVAELLYGLLLPSGNDAATALAEHFGPRLAPESAKDLSPIAQFVAAMNQEAARLALSRTRYANPHGLTAAGHHSTASELAKLTLAALEEPRFREYVGTRERGCRIVGPGGEQRDVIWKNTNQLLAISGYSGVKTGTTGAAGACLISTGERDGKALLVVVLGSASSDARYVDSRNLFRWAWREAAQAAQK